MRRTWIRNTYGQLSISVHPPRNVNGTVHHQLTVARYNQTRHLNSLQLDATRFYLISHSSHDFPPSLSALSGPGSSPCNFYRITSFDKLYFLDLGMLSQFCELWNTILNGTSSPTFSNHIHLQYPFFHFTSCCPAVLLHPVPLLSALQPSMDNWYHSSRICRIFVAFLDWFVGCSSWRSPFTTICTSFGRLQQLLMQNTWMDVTGNLSVELYMFYFGVITTDVFKVLVSTKLYRLMRHVENHLVHRW